MSDKDSEEETTSSSEDEEPILDESSDKCFFKALSCLKKKDPRIYDPTVNFFPSQEETEGKAAQKKTDKPVFLRDYEREQIIKVIEKEKSNICPDKDAQVDDEDEDLPYAVQQKSLKASLKAALDESDSDDGEGLLKLKTKTREDREKEEEEYKSWLKGVKDEIDDKETENALKPLHDYWCKPDLDPNEKFLKDYILNRRYLEEGEEIEDDGVSEDGELLEMQERFENEYNMRFETDNNTEVKRFPRVIEGSLRRKNEARKLKRKEKKDRKLLEKGKKKEEIVKNQKQKLLEFKEHIEKMKKLTGNDQLGFNDEDIFGDADFDPEKHDKLMQEVYNDAFYAAQDDEEKPDFLAEENVDDWEGEEDFADPDNMDLEVAPSCSYKTKKETRSGRKRKEKKKKNGTDDILDIAKPVFDPLVHGSVQKYIDEFYNMDCEDFIEDIPCRFKYKQVVPNDYGLTVEEILAADDKDLNKWVPAKKITKLKPDHVEKNEVKVYRQKGQDFNLKKKILLSVYGSPEREDDQEDEGHHSENKLDNHGSDNVLPNMEKGNKKRKRKANESQTEDSAAEQNGNESAAVKKKKNNDPKQMNVQVNKGPKQLSNKNRKTPNKFSGKERRKDWKDSKNKEVDQLAAVSDLRLKAYDIKPREFKKKLKYKK